MCSIFGKFKKLKHAEICLFLCTLILFYFNVVLCRWRTIIDNLMANDNAAFRDMLSKFIVM